VLLSMADGWSPAVLIVDHILVMQVGKVLEQGRDSGADAFLHALAAFRFFRKWLGGISRLNSRRFSPPCYFVLRFIQSRLRHQGIVSMSLGCLRFIYSVVLYKNLLY